MNRRLVYTVIFGDYDHLAELEFITPGVDYICVTDNENITSKTWNILLIEASDDAIGLNRRYKIKPMEFFDYDESIYIDGNISITGDLNYIFDKYLSDSYISISPHPFRNCLYDEAEVCVEIGKAKKEQVHLQLVRYMKNKFPRNYGLYENNVIVRKHNSSVKKIMDLWYSEFQNYTKRDQLSLCYCFWKFNVKCSPLLEGPRYSDKYFNFRLHRKELVLPWFKKLALLSNVRQKQCVRYKLLNFIFSILRKVLKK